MEFTEFMRIYGEDVYFRKLKEIYEKYKNYPDNGPSARKKIADSLEQIYRLQLRSKFTMFPNILLECIIPIRFKSYECLKIYLTLYRIMVRNNISEHSRLGRYSIRCKKSYLHKICNTKSRQNLYRALEELEEKNMLFEEKDIYGDFIFTLNLSFQSWNVNEEEKDMIMNEVERAIRILNQDYGIENPI